MMLVSLPLFSRTSTKYRRNPHKIVVSKRLPKDPCIERAFLPDHESQIRQNAEIDRLGLTRIQNDYELRQLISKGELVPIPVGLHLRVDPKLPANRRYVRPWTAQFLTDLSDQFYEEFHTYIQVNSAVRTVEFQKKLQRRNKNAAPPVGEKASSHLAGLTVDLERRRLTKEQVKFIEAKLVALNNNNLVEVIEEFRQLCFHVMVSGRYKTDWQIPPLPIPPPPEPDKPVFADNNERVANVR